MRGGVSPQSRVLSAMAFPFGVAALWFCVAVIHPPSLDHVEAAFTGSLRRAFLLTLLLMGVHLGERIAFRSPRRPEPPTIAPEAPFLVGFALGLLPMLVMLYLALLGPPYHVVLLTIWIATGHQVALRIGEALAQRRPIPGTFSGVIFTTTMGLLLFPAAHDLVFATRGIPFQGYYFSLGLTLLFPALRARRTKRQRSSASTQRRPDPPRPSSIPTRASS